MEILIKLKRPISVLDMVIKRSHELFDCRNGSNDERDERFELRRGRRRDVQRGKSATARMRLLRHPRPGVGSHVQLTQEVVLQRTRQHVGESHREPLGARQVQGGHAAQRRPARRDPSRVLQLRMPQCLPARLHSCQGRLGCCFALPAAVRFSEQSQGLELGS